MEANPGFNAIASHISLKKEAKLKEAVEKGKHTRKNDPRLSNSDAHGGQNAVITERFRERTGAGSGSMNLDTCKPTMQD